VVPSSGSAFPRHWAWSHGAVACAARDWTSDGKRRPLLPGIRAAQRDGIGTKRARTSSRVC